MVKNRKCLSVWQERTVASVDLLHNEEERIQCALLILQSAPVPWSNVLNPLLKYRQSSHRLSADIRTEYDLQKIKILKQKYNWPAESKDSLMKLAFRIVKLDRDDMFDDINFLTKTDVSQSANINFYCANELARKGNIEKAVNFIDSIPDHREVKNCCEKILNISSVNMKAYL